MEVDSGCWQSHTSTRAAWQSPGTAAVTPQVMRRSGMTAFRVEGRVSRRDKNLSNSAEATQFLGLQEVGGYQPFGRVSTLREVLGILIATPMEVNCYT